MLHGSAGFKNGRIADTDPREEAVLRKGALRALEASEKGDCGKSL
jgi:hypothetical protein